MDKFLNAEYLIDKIAKSDTDAIDYFHDKYHRLIYKSIREIVKKEYPYSNEYEIQNRLKDLYVDVFIKILSNIHSIREKEEPVLRSFIWKVARTTAIDYCKKEKKSERIKKKTGIYEDNPDILYNVHNDGEEYSAREKEAIKELIRICSEKSCHEQEQRDIRQDVYQAIETRLDDRERVFVKLYLSGFTGEKIAKIMRLNRVTIQTIKNNVIQKLREALF